MIVKQVQNALQILEFFASRKRPAGLSEIADHFGWPRSSTFNLIETLARGGYVYEPRHRGGYYPTHRLLSLAQTIVAHGPVSDELHTMVANVAAASGETAVLAGLSGGAGVFVDVVESPHPIRYIAEIGQRIPLYATSAGRALLSLLSPRERGAILRKTDYVRYAPATLMSAEEVEAEIARSNERGYFVNDNGYSLDLVGVAIPLALPDRHLCLLVAGPAYRASAQLEPLAALLLSEIARLENGDLRSGLD
ncbi:IclR family transcriptional regulator [Enterovirga rhinocerotis]|uniref:IclR family transcriptional regulator n=1 Tax=Enterovirga rhinocerotis TaxID=1339210 RepID=A0A4R7BWR7_9HYPH|nr:IclR family transcriptional regulator [Enterovirga rhinocerotis]TDR90368.1 IclR family transcriptional regulator [Enterovirga rhinocerotis]